MPSHIFVRLGLWPDSINSNIAANASAASAAEMHTAESHYMLPEAKRSSNALAEYKVVLKNAPNRFDALLGAGRASQASGDSSGAQTFYAKLTQVCPGRRRPGRNPPKQKRSWRGNSRPLN